MDAKDAINLYKSRDVSEKVFRAVRKQVENPCEAYKIKASQNLHKIISTHLLTVLIICAILHIEQRKGIQREQRKRFPGVPERSWFQRNKV